MANVGPRRFGVVCDNIVEMEYLSHSEEETAKIAVEFVQKLVSKSEGATVLGLYGELGAGKSSFTRALAGELGVKEKIQSPTFVIMKNYTLNASPFTFLVHIDAYRLEKEEELEKLGWKEIITNKTNLVVVEWAERVEKILPKDFVRINFEHVSDNERRIRI
jgi:tRNA threonylcarbamoyladenosine biosynthesis protein TsaE